MKISNNHGISLPLALWLVSDGYDFHPGQSKAISVTSIMKPLRQILLSERLDESTAQTPDVSDYISSRMGHALHDSIEKSWIGDFKGSLGKLGYPQKIIDRVLVNPSQEELRDAQLSCIDPITAYLERRTSRLFRGYRISGKFDLILDGEMNDFKSTSTYAWTSGSKDDDYILQKSLYRWLNPELVTSDTSQINFIFTDWQKYKVGVQKDYPPLRVMTKTFNLLSIEEVEAWLNQKIDDLEASADLPEGEIPFCSDKELWRTDPVFKYFSDPAKANTPGARSTKNFETLVEASAFKASKGGKGVVVTVPGKVRACSYCAAFNICTQKDLYDHG